LRQLVATQGKVRVWTAVNAVVLGLITAWILWPSSPNSTGLDQAGHQGSGHAPATTKAPPRLPTKADILAAGGVRFGLSSPQAPWSRSEIDGMAAAAGEHPTMLQFFVKWTEPFRPDAVSASYDEKALPIISWEPWAGVKAGPCQAGYALPRIINGAFDAYITTFATAVAKEKVPIAIRFAHEMNGNWYPWSEHCAGNHPGDYIKAWRHVHDLFIGAGADNVIWIWSPNIIRPVPDVSIKALYPGDAYVDWVGMVGYAVHETTAAPVFEPTMQAIRKFTQLPIILTETGVESGPRKAAWISSFFQWLPRQHGIVGFVWFEYSREQGGSADWRFTETKASTNAFHNGLIGLTLAGPPTAAASPSPSTGTQG
jgi:hypothetical protein